MKKVAVIGSLSTDFVVRTATLPHQGETVIGESFKTFFGGKGANQAIAAKRAGLDVYMFGAVGQDSFGKRLIENLQMNGIHTEGIESIENVESGSAHIQINEGDNRIIIIPGANNQVSITLIRKQLNLLQKMDLLILQNEIPMETIRFIIEFANEKKIKVLYNPAPVKNLDKKIIEMVDYLTPNEHECSSMFLDKELQKVLKQFPNKLIVTLGDKGAIYYDGSEIQQINSEKIRNVVDTTGAGDTFNGFLAKGIAEEMDLSKSIRLGNKAAALAIQHEGAQAGIPFIEEVEKEK